MLEVKGRKSSGSKGTGGAKGKGGEWGDRWWAAALEWDGLTGSSSRRDVAGATTIWVMEQRLGGETVESRREARERSYEA